MLRDAHLERDVGAFIDDLANGGHDPKQALAAAHTLFSALDAVNFRMGADKVFLGLTALPLVGYVVKAGQLTVDSDRVAAIAALCPQNNHS